MRVSAARLPDDRLVGRENLVADIAELSRANRLITLSGVGGVGKTRLALEVGAVVAGVTAHGLVKMIKPAPKADQEPPAANAGKEN